MSDKMDLIMEGWRRFLTEAEDVNQQLATAFASGPQATRAFLNSPLGKSQQVRDILAKGDTADANPQDDVVQIGEPTPISVKGLMPTQNFIDMMQSISFPLGSKDSLVKAITKKTGFGTIVVDKNLVIDGHHRWSAVVAITPNDGQINAINVSWPGKTTKEKLSAAQLSIAAHVGPNKEQPSATGEAATNILGKQAREIEALVLQYVNKQTDPKAPGPLLNDQMMKDIVNTKEQVIYQWAGIPNSVTDINAVRKAIAKKVGENLATIQSNPEAPGRPDMPQFDPKVGGPELSTITPDLKAGKLNVTPPFKAGKQTTVQKESLKKIVRQVIRENLKRR